MNDPLISPWFFYGVEVMGRLNCGLTFLLLGAIFPLIINFIERGPEKTKRWILLWFTFAIIWIFIPSRNTVYSMTIANNITQANIEKLGDITDKTIDKLIDKVISAGEKWERRNREGK